MSRRGRRALPCMHMYKAVPLLFTFGEEAVLVVYCITRGSESYYEWRSLRVRPPPLNLILCRSSYRSPPRSTSELRTRPPPRTVGGWTLTALDGSTAGPEPTPPNPPSHSPSHRTASCLEPRVRPPLNGGPPPSSNVDHHSFAMSPPSIVDSWIEGGVCRPDPPFKCRSERAQVGGVLQNDLDIKSQITR